MIADAWLFLVRAALGATCACVFVLAVRMPVRRWFGARAAYAAWSLVPFVALAALLPAPLAPPVHATNTLAAAPATVAATPAQAFDPRPWLLLAWLAGIGVAALATVAQQRRYVRGIGLGRHASTRLVRAGSVASGPALVGAWRPRVVVPRDFPLRYDARERRLILAHERVHLARGDAWTNAFVAAVRCVHWFNPIVHFAATCLRQDQELACDAVVIERFPDARAAYAGAMLKTQLAAQGHAESPLPVGCRWSSRHPIQERVLMLKRRMPSRARRAVGATLVAVLGLGVAYTAWATQAPRVAAPDPTAEQVDARFLIAVGDSGASAVRVVARVGEPFAVSGDTPRPWHLEATARRVDGGVSLEAILARDGRLVSKPSIVVADGQSSHVEIGARGAADYFRLDSTLTLHPADWRVDPAAGDAGASVLRHGADVAFRMPATRLAAAGGSRAASEDVSFRAESPPAYPAQAIAARQHGHVDLRVDVDERGRPTSAAVVHADPAEAETVFGPSAIATAMTWSFNPPIENGRAIATTVRVPIDYRLNDDE